MNAEKTGGLAVSGGLWLIGYSLLRWSERQNQNVLLGVLIGGILFRIAFVLISIFFVRKLTDLELMPYVISLIIFYLACEFALIADYILRR